MRSLVAWTVLVLSSAVAGQQGCAPYQKFPQHTMCIYNPKTCQPGVQLVRSGGLSEKQKAQVVNVHNKLRQQIVAGKVRGAPAAVRMSTMVWDDELAMIAQRAADQCKFAHDKQRRVARFYVGQNIFISMRKPVEKNTNPNMTQAALSWFNEVRNPGFPKANISPFKAVDGAGHYTQMAWADTKTIGCGYVMFIDKGWSKKLIFCNYGPGGNVIGGTMYEVQ